jgi:hypothetical protein
MWEVPCEMPDAGIGDYFISDDDEALDEEEELVVVPVVLQPPVAAPVAPAEPVAMAPSAPQPVVQAAPQPVAQPAAPPAMQPAPAPQPDNVAVSATGTRPQTSVRQASREERLAVVLDELMVESPDIQAAALVSMDGFTMASALPQGMQEDRVGAMSAAILGLGERAATELGRGHLTQVFIEGDDGYVVLIAAGERAVLTALTTPDSKLGLVLYDMKTVAGTMAEILG